MSININDMSDMSDIKNMKNEIFNNVSTIYISFFESLYNKLNKINLYNYNNLILDDIIIKCFNEISIMDNDLLINLFNDGNFLDIYRQNIINNFMINLQNIKDLFVFSLLDVQFIEIYLKFYEYISTRIFYYKDTKETIFIKDVISKNILEYFNISNDAMIINSSGNGQCFLNSILRKLQKEQIESVLYDDFTPLKFISEIMQLSNCPIGLDFYKSSVIGPNTIKILKKYFIEMEPVIIIISEHNGNTQFEIFDDEKYSNKNYYFFLCNKNNIHYDLIEFIDEHEVIHIYNKLLSLLNKKNNYIQYNLSGHNINITHNI